MGAPKNYLSFFKLCNAFFLIFEELIFFVLLKVFTYFLSTVFLLSGPWTNKSNLFFLKNLLSIIALDFITPEIYFIDNKISFRLE